MGRKAQKIVVDMREALKTAAVSGFLFVEISTIRTLHTSKQTRA